MLLLQINMILIIILFLYFRNMIVHITLGKLKLNKSNGVVNVVHNLALNQSKLRQVEVWGISDNNFICNKRAYSLKIFKRSLLHFLV